MPYFTIHGTSPVTWAGKFACMVLHDFIGCLRLVPPDLLLTRESVRDERMSAFVMPPVCTSIYTSALDTGRELLAHPDSGMRVKHL